MDKYGKLIETLETPHSVVYSIISSYFDDPVMTKVKVNSNIAFYAARAPSFMLREYRYLIALVTDNKAPIGDQAKLSEIPWVSFQTRTLEEDWRLKTIEWSDKSDQKYKEIIKQIRREEDTFYYRTSKYPIEIALLTPKKTFPSYQPEGTILRALETFQTVIIFN
jgi:hypothetical protein